MLQHNKDYQELEMVNLLMANWLLALRAKNEINPSLTEVWFFQLLCIHIDTFSLEVLIAYVKIWCKPSSSSIVELEALYKHSKNKHWKYVKFHSLPKVLYLFGVEFSEKDLYNARTHYKN
jgi:hypothetical protein